MKRQCMYAGVCVALMVASGCAFDVYHLKQLPATMESGRSARDSFQLVKEQEVDLGNSYKRTLRKGTRWTHVGTIRQGEVFKTADQILTVEASNVHEAYIVVSSNKLVGFYLPVEKAYSPLSEPVDLSIGAVVQGMNQ